MSSKSTSVSLSRAIQLLEPLDQEGVEWLVIQGYHRLCTVFRNSISTLEKVARSRRNLNLLSDYWFYLGHLHHCNNAPEASVRAYRNSAKYTPGVAECWRELGGMYEICGDVTKARYYFKKALQIDPSDTLAKSDLKDSFIDPAGTIKYALKNSLAPGTKTAEFLAKMQPKAAWEVIKHSRKPKYLLLKARVHGAFGNHERALHYWKLAANSMYTFEITTADVFFLSEGLWESPEYWRTIRSMKHRMTGLAFSDPLNLGKLFAPPDLIKPQNYNTKRTQRIDTITKFQIARIERNIPDLQLLDVQYPDWKYPRVTVSFIKKHKRAPSRLDLWPKKYAGI